MDLSPGLNTVTVTVTAENKSTTMDYVLVIGRGHTDTYRWKAVDDLDGLIAAGNEDPFGIWGNESTLWVVDTEDDKIYAYNRDGTQDSSKEFSLHSDNDSPTGVWSDGETMWIADSDDSQVYAYQLSDGARDSSKDISLASNNSDPGDIWSDGETMWVVDEVVGTLFAYQLSDGTPLLASNRDISSANTSPTGLWSDGDDFWTAESGLASSLAWTLADGTRITNSDFQLPTDVGLTDKRSIWSDGETMWVVSAEVDKVYSFNVPPRIQVSFSASAYSVQEGGTVTVPVTLAVDPRREVTILLTRTDLDETTTDDYSGVPDRLVFISGENH